MATLRELLEEKEKLEQQISNMQSQARADAIAQVKQIMAEHGLTLGDITDRAPRPSKKPQGEKRKVPAKYRDEQGNTWSGRGLQPNWLKAALKDGRKLDDFAV